MSSSTLRPEPANSASISVSMQLALPWVLVLGWPLRECGSNWHQWLSYLLRSNDLQQRFNANLRGIRLQGSSQPGRLQTSHGSRQLNLKENVPATVQVEYQLYWRSCHHSQDVGVRQQENRKRSILQATYFDHVPNVLRLYCCGTNWSLCLCTHAIFVESLGLLACWLTGKYFFIQIVYVTCCSGIIYDIIHDVPMTGKDQKTGETIIFSGGNREQYGL